MKKVELDKEDSVVPQLVFGQLQVWINNKNCAFKDLFVNDL